MAATQMGPEGIDLARLRREYEDAGLDREQMSADPLVQFDRWLGEALNAELVEPNAMVVSTVDANGQPWARHLLLKARRGDGFEFYTNYGSDKATQLDRHPNVALTFGWLGLHRQVCIAGRAERVSDADSDAYFAVRPRGSQLGAWASEQSKEILDRSQLTEAWAAADARYPDEVPRPPHWGGYRVFANEIEFWQGRPSRLHDRMRYRRTTDQSWHLTRLSP